MNLKKEYTPLIQIDCLTYAGSEASGVGLDQYIARCYNLAQDFEIIDCANDTYHKFTVEPLDISKPWNVTKVQEAITNGNCEIYNLGYVLDKMCLDGFLPAGTYLVYMSW